MTLFSAAFGYFSGEAFFGFSADVLPYAAVLGVAGYAGIFAYLSSSRHMPLSTALAIAYGYVVVLYFVNARLFEAERLSNAKFAFAFAFFATVAAFLFHANRSGAKFLRHVWMPLVSLVCWTAYFGCANYVVKTGIASPAWSLMLAEGSIFTAAVAAFASRSAWRFAVRSRSDGSSRTGRSASDRAKAVSGFKNGIAMAVLLAL